jgi:competence protein ComEA
LASVLSHSQSSSSSLQGPRQFQFFKRSRPLPVQFLPVHFLPVQFLPVLTPPPLESPVIPGVYQLPEGSRVIDAITIAGGVKLGVSTSHINLARKLVDGEQVLIMKEKFISAPTSSGRKSIFAGKVSLNSASKAQFDSLPGIGPVIAQRIIDYRNKNGPFQTLESIQSVSGIGESIFRQISSRLTL